MLKSIIKEGLYLAEKLGNGATGALVDIAKKVNDLAEDAYDLEEKNPEYARTLAEDSVRLGRETEKYVVRSRNLFNVNSPDMLYKKWYTTTGWQDLQNGAVSGKISTAGLPVGTMLTLSYNKPPSTYEIVFFDENDEYIKREYGSGSQTPLKGSITADTAYVRVAASRESGTAMDHAQMEDYKLMLVIGSTALPYEEYGTQKIVR